MDVCRRKGLYAFSVLAILTCACAINSRRSTEGRLAEDLQSDGLIIVFQFDQDSSETTVAVMDAESIDRFSRWFRNRPKSSGAIESKVISKMMLDLGERVQSPSLRFQTGHCRVEFVLYISHAVLNTRASVADEWRQDSWDMRPEDMELQKWALSLITAEMIRTLPEGDVDVPARTDDVSE